MSLLLYLALGALAVAIIFGLSTDVRAAVRRLLRQRKIERVWVWRVVTRAE